MKERGKEWRKHTHTHTSQTRTNISSPIKIWTNF